MLPILLLLLGQSAEFSDQKIDAGVLVEIKNSTSAKSIRYVSQSPGLVVVPPEKAKDPTSCLCVAIEPGVYSIQVLTASADFVNEPKYFRVTATKKPGPGPTPGPGPAPGPTPGPGPGPVDPNDGIFTALSGIVGGLSEPGQKASLKKLAGVYQAGANAAAGLTTRADFDSVMRKAFGEAGLLGGQLVAVRQYCLDVVNEKLGNGYDGASAASVCSRIASALAKLGE
jgi:hypothetical protein